MSASPTGKSLFRVTYRDGSSVTTTAKTSLQASAKAVKSKPGEIKKIDFLRKTST